MTPAGDGGVPRPLAARLDAGEPLTALLVKMPSAGQIESAGHTGFDLVIIDTEHGPGGGFELEHHLRAAAGVGLPALVRVPDERPSTILAALDAGADGVIVPHVLDAAGAAAVVAACRYPPLGRRGFALSTRAGGYGAAGVEEHLRRSAAETVVVVQIEDAEAVGNAAGILAVEGVSGVLIGASDLSLSLGRPGTPLHADVEAAIDRTVAAAAAAGVPVLAVVASPAAAAAWRTRGAGVTAFVATNLIHAAFAAAVGGAPGAGSDLREPLVLLPGMLGDARLWDAVALALLDLSEPRVSRIDLDDSVAEMAASVLASAPPRFALAGHSLGAIVALEIVRRAPGRVSRLALLNASALPPSEAQLAAWSALRVRATNGGFAEIVGELAAANLPAERRDGPLVGVGAEMARAVGAAGLLRQLTAQGTRPDSRPSLWAIGVPTLVLGGARDEVCPNERQRELAEGIAAARLVLLDGVGHLSPLEDPEAVAGHLAAWLRW